MIVVVAVTERQVIINDAFNPAPLQGGPLSIFNKKPTHTETRLDVQVVGTYTSLIDADEAERRWLATHPGCRIEKQQVKANLLPGDAEPPAPTTCIGCGAVCATTRCPPCQQAFIDSCRQQDPELQAAIAAGVPVT